MNGFRAGAFASIALTLAGCATGPSLFVGDGVTPSSDVDMTGRWKLSAPNAPSCGMNFTVKPGANEGTVVPEGGCPERFFTSRNWTLAQGKLTIGDDKKQALAHLDFSGGQFEGKSNTDTPVTLAR